MLPSISVLAVPFLFLVIISIERTWLVDALHNPIKTLSTSHQQELCLRADHGYRLYARHVPISPLCGSNCM